MNAKQAISSQCRQRSRAQAGKKPALRDSAASAAARTLERTGGFG
jgi:hypothetical protein